jgi:SH3 domain protein
MLFFKEDTMQICQRIAMVMFMAFLCNATVAWSETLYISDQLVVSLRELPQRSAESIVYLKTDTPVEVLEVNGEYTQVKTANGEIGYVQRSYLSASLPKTVVIKRLTSENEKLNGRIQELEKRYSEAFAKGDEAQVKILAELEESRDQAVKLQRDLHESNTALAEITKAHKALRENNKNVIAITDERNQLKLSNEKLSASVSTLETENNELLKKESIQWFLTGAGVLFLGWLLGKLSKSRRKGSLYS